ncbi:MAG: hypothetical protein ABI325_10920 [Ginsengibacter sp.]
MSLPQKFYLTHINKHTGYRGNWLPDRPLRLGDIGKLEDGLFTLYTTLEQQQIKFLTREGVSTLDFDYSSSDSVDITTNFDTGNLIGSPAKGNITISFNSNNGIVFQMTESKKAVIEDLNKVEEAVLQRYETKSWPKEWVVISELITTDHATIIISTSSNNKIELECDVPVNFAKIRLADPKLNLNLVRETGSSTKILGANSLTPLYQVKGIYKPYFSNPEFRTRLDVTDEIENTVFEDLLFDEKEFRKDR